MEQLKIYKNNQDPERNQVMQKNIHATGFPSPARDHLEESLSLDRLLVSRPAATYYVRTEGSDMKRSGIHDGDILVVDRSLHPKEDSVVVVIADAEALIRRLVKRANAYYLISDNPSISPILYQDDREIEIWGVVTHVIHNCY